jgi:hypothetical protein
VGDYSPRRRFSGRDRHSDRSSERLRPHDAVRNRSDRHTGDEPHCRRNSYFRESALSVETGSYGNKVDPLGPRAYLDPHAKTKADNLAGKVDFVTAAGMDWQQTSSADIGLNGSLPVFGMSGSAAVNSATKRPRTRK